MPNMQTEYIETFQRLSRVMRYILTNCPAGSWTDCGYPAYEIIRSCRESIHRDLFPDGYRHKYA